MRKKGEFISWVYKRPEIKDYLEIVGKEGKIINFEGISDGYRGLAFFTPKEWSERIINAKLINDRIAVMPFKLGKEG